MKYKCIYCKQEKDESEFNREHVVPRMMGTYENGFVLNSYEVCEECNSYFSRELENQVSLNSMESFLRIQHGRPMSDGRTMENDRISFFGANEILKGMQLIPVVDSTNKEKIHFDIAPQIGVLSFESGEYLYYEIDKLPEATTEVLDFLKEKEKGIIILGISQEEAETILKEKGYLVGEFTYLDVLMSDIYKGDSFITDINLLIDSVLRRMCAKTVFNYLCYCMGKEYVLSDKFDEIRKYIRYGEWDENLWFRYSYGPVSAVNLPNETSHVVGYMMYPERDRWILCGNLTWFGELTYVFKLGLTDKIVSKFNRLPCTKMAYFDNETRKITEDEAVYIFQESVHHGSEK